MGRKNKNGRVAFPENVPIHPKNIGVVFTQNFNSQLVDLPELLRYEFHFLKFIKV